MLCIERIGRPELAVALGCAVLLLQSRELVRAQELIRRRPRCQLLLLLLLLLLLIEAVEASIELLQKEVNVIFRILGFQMLYRVGQGRTLI